MCKHTFILFYDRLGLSIISIKDPESLAHLMISITTLLYATQRTRK